MSLGPLALLALFALPSVPDVREGLAELAESFPEACDVDTLGRSGEGRDLWLGVLARGEAPAGRPGLLVLDYGEADRSADVLDLARALLEAQAKDARVRSLLERTAVWIAPALDPDRTPGTGGQAGRVPAFDRDFPARWRSRRREPLAGPYPLHLSETRALTAFLDAHPSIALVLVFAPAGAEPAVGAGDGAARPVLELASRFPTLGLRGPESLPDGPGSLVAWCSEGVGTDVLGILPPPRDGGEATDRSRRAAQLLVELLAGLPRLALEVGPAVGSGGGAVRIDARVRNLGSVTTAIDRVRWSAERGGVDVEVSGARVVAAALRDPGAATFRVVDPVRAGEAGEAGSRLRLGPLGPGEECVVRLVLEPVGPVSISASSLRAGGARQQLTVR